MKFNKKGQMGGTAGVIISLFLGLMVIGILQVVSVLTLSSVSGNLVSSIPFNVNFVQNESTAVPMNTDSTNSTLLSKSGILLSTITVQNKTSYNQLTKNVDYSVVILASSGNGADTTSRVNFTLINPAYNFSNTTGLNVNYYHNTNSQYQTTAANLKTNTLDSFELGGTAQIVLAAATIIAAVFGLIFFARGK